MLTNHSYLQVVEFLKKRKVSEITINNIKSGRFVSSNFIIKSSVRSLFNAFVPCHFIPTLFAWLLLNNYCMRSSKI